MYQKVIVFILIASSLFANSPKSNRIANYDIKVNLDTKNKTLRGNQTLTWTNKTSKPTSELQFHLYLNAFKDENSTFFKESGGQLRGDKMDTTKLRNFGNIYLSTLKIRNGENLYPKIKFIQPDDLNTYDKTVVQVKLTKAINPGETVVLEMDFRAKLPKIFARTGWADHDYFFIGQWFPKIGVLEESGKWNCHQFHANTEFFADFGNYNVQITLPQNFAVAATGEKISEIKNKNNIKTVSFSATDVHDFAWTTSPHYKYLEQRYKGIKIMAYMQPEHFHLANRYFESAQNSINYMEKRVGKYPHSTLSLIDPSLSGSGSGGMEYPTLITCGSYWGVESWGKFQEVVTIHEFVHQYFQGMVASNEFENSWMDEGFTQYYEGRIMQEYYKSQQANIFGFTLHDMASSRASYVMMDNPKITEIRRNAWSYPGGTYGIMTYQKTATWLKTLEGLLGTQNMDLLMQTYFARFKFKHPQPQDFIDTANEIASKHTKFVNLDWFFKQVLFEAPDCDYAVADLTNAPRKQAAFGSFTVNRLGEMIFPSDIKVVFDDNKFEIMHWSGAERYKKYKFRKRIKYVQIDPGYINWMDLNMINNSAAAKEPTKAAAKYSTKILFWVQRILFFFGGLG
ncbi:MAG TPA: M1 family metallopeptidase [Leadbetterella sp.]|nr:M1 family metallopeptidase [Leadbetterella sp.]